VSSPDLATWLLEQIAEDERLARAAARLNDDEPEDLHWDTVVGRLEDAGWEREEVHRLDKHVVNFDPARVLAECDAKRRIIAQHDVDDGDCRTCFDPNTTNDWPENMVQQCWPCPTLRLLAAVYSDRPGYREEWKLA
jgi:hypothetical protein